MQDFYALKFVRKRQSASEALQHKWLSQDVKFMRAKRLSTEKHKRYMAKRKWQVKMAWRPFNSIKFLLVLRKPVTPCERSVECPSCRRLLTPDATHHQRDHVHLPSTVTPVVHPTRPTLAIANFSLRFLKKLVTSVMMLY